MSEATKQDGRYRRLVREIARYLKQEGAVRRAVNEPLEQIVVWEALEEALDFHMIERASILEMSDYMGVEIVTMPRAGVYLGVKGEKAKVLWTSYKHAKSRCATIRRRMAIMSQKKTLPEVQSFARQNGFELKEIVPLLDAAGQALPPAVTTALLAPPTETEGEPV